MQLVRLSYVSKLKLPSPRASLVFSSRQVAAFPRLGPEGVIPVLASGIAATRMASSPRSSLITASPTKASKTPTSLVHNVRRAQDSGAGQGIRLKLMARSLAPRCVTTSGHLDVLAIVSLSRPCTTVRRVVSISV